MPAMEEANTPVKVPHVCQFFKFKILPPICRNPPVIPFRDFAQKNSNPPAVSIEIQRISGSHETFSAFLTFIRMHLILSQLLKRFFPPSSILIFVQQMAGRSGLDFLRFNSIWLCCNLVNGTRAEQERNGFLQIIHVPFFVVKRTPGRCFPPTKKKKRNHKTFGELF